MTISHRSVAAVAAFVGMAALPAAAGAQQPGDAMRLDTLVVTGSTVTVPLTATSTGVTVITGEALRARGVQHVADALRAVPGLAVVQSGPLGSVTSLFLRGGESDYVQVLIDGVPVNEPGGRADLANLSTTNIERIEVVRGPGSVLYGSDAVTGVVQIFTREGRGTPRLDAEVRGGSHGSLGYEAGVQGANGPVSYSLAASHFGTDGTYDVNNEYAQTTLSGLVRLRADDRTDAKISIRFSDGEYHFPTDGAGRIADLNQFNREKRMAVGLEAGRFLTDRLEARLRLTASDLDFSIHDDPDDEDDVHGIYAYYSQTDQQRREVDLHLNAHLSPTTVLTAGVQYEAQEERNHNEYESDGGPGSGSFAAERANRGYYVQAITDVGGAVSLNFGARLDDNDTFGTFETFRAGAAWRLPTGTRLRAAVGTAFKEPTFAENFSEGYTTGNPDLVPERTRSWEAGIEQRLLGERLLLSGTWFDQRFRDMIQYDGNVAPGEPNYRNLAAANASGIELEASLRATGNLSLSASYTRLRSEVEDAGADAGPDAEFVEGLRLIRRPDHTFNVTAGYRFLDRGSVDLAVLHVGERDDLDFADWPAKRVSLDAYTRVDLGAEVRLLDASGNRPAVTATLRVDNLFDAEYQEIVHFPARGRTILLGARLGFGGR